MIETARCAHARLQLCESARGNLPFQRFIHFFRVLGRAASFRVLLGPTIDADKEIALALQRGQSRIRRGGGQRPKISRQIRSKRLTSNSEDCWLMCSRSFETRSFPSSLAATHRGFAFYVAFPKSSIRPLGLPIRRTGGGRRRVGLETRITRISTNLKTLFQPVWANSREFVKFVSMRPQFPSAVPLKLARFPSRSPLPIAALPSMSLLPPAPLFL